MNALSSRANSDRYGRKLIWISCEKSVWNGSKVIIAGAIFRVRIYRMSRECEKEKQAVRSRGMYTRSLLFFIHTINEIKHRSRKAERPR